MTNQPEQQPEPTVCRKHRSVTPPEIPCPRCERDDLTREVERLREERDELRLTLDVRDPDWEHKGDWVIRARMYQREYVALEAEHQRVLERCRHVLRAAERQVVALDSTKGWINASWVMHHLRDALSPSSEN